MPNNEKSLLIIGEVFIDVHLDKVPIINRLGGIFHSARALHSLSKKYALAAIAPSYLNDSIHKFGNNLGAVSCSIIGEMKNVPNVMLIKDSTESGKQGYEDILRCQVETSIDVTTLKNIIDEFNPTDILIYPGKYNLIDLCPALVSFSGGIHIDFQYENHYLESFSQIVNIQTIILSTSSATFINTCKGNLEYLNRLLEGKTKGVLLKENRGGSRYYDYVNDNWIIAPAFLVPTAHSVGVGDCFNSVFITSDEDINTSLRLASYAASWYASTFDHNTFVSNVQGIYDLELKESIKIMLGTRLSWEDRAHQHIYIAGPDFPHIDTKWIQTISDNLAYHNFVPHRPVRENGIIHGDETETVQMQVYSKDLELLEKCSLLIAVLLNDDPGTYVEIGWMARFNKPTILFDPYHRASNLFLKKTVTKICYTPVEVIDAVFQYLISGGEDSYETSNF